MWQLSEAIDGMTEACVAFGLPVVGGNVSLYNESKGIDIDPTPVVGVLAMVDELDAPPPGKKWNEGDRIVLLGDPDATELSGSRWAFDNGHREGSLAPLDTSAHLALTGLVRDLVNDTGLLSGVHDVSTGGLGVCLAEMAIASGVGCTVARIRHHAQLFSEAPSRVVVAVSAEDLAIVEQRAGTAGVPVTRLGLAHSDLFTIKGLLEIPLEEVTTAARDLLPNALGAGTSQG
jgi:phosphoribosylformylglycinamidine synthase